MNIIHMQRNDGSFDTVPLCFRVLVVGKEICVLRRAHIGNEPSVEVNYVL